MQHNSSSSRGTLAEKLELFVKNTYQNLPFSGCGPSKKSAIKKKTTSTKQSLMKAEFDPCGPFQKANRAKHGFTRYALLPVFILLTLGAGLSLPSLAQAAKVTLEWDANDPAPEGYRVYMRTENQTYDYNSPVWSGTTTTCEIDQLAENTYYFVARAFDTDVESGDSNEAEYTIVANKAPQADAGSDQAVSANTLVTLDGSASSDPEGAIATYQWRQTAGPTVSLDNAAAAAPSFTAPDVATTATISFELTVADPEGLTSADSCQVTVLPVTNDNNSTGGDTTDSSTGNDDSASDGTILITENVFSPIADTFVNVNDPSTNFGSASTIEIDGSPKKMGYLKFEVSGITGSVESAIIQLHVTNASPFGGTIYLVSDNSWDESNMTYNNCPSFSGQPIYELGAVKVGDIVDIDVTSAITGNGLYSFAIVSSHKNGADFSSKESSEYQPELIVESAETQDDNAIQDIVFVPNADTFADASKPNTNYGNAATFEVDGSPVKIVYLRFNVTDIDSDIEQAILKLSVTNASSYGGAIYIVPDNNWDETQLTYNNRPSHNNTLLKEMGAVNVGDIVEVDITAAITGNGEYSFAIVSDDRNGADFHSRESQMYQPELHIKTKSISSFAPMADASVTSDNPNQNYGLSDILEVDGVSEKISYLRFQVNGVSGKINSARIILHVADPSEFGGKIYGISNNDWNEETVTYNNRPEIDGYALDALPAVNLSEQVAFDVTDWIQDNGTYNFAIISDNKDGVDYFSSEAGANSPELIITTLN